MRNNHLDRPRFRRPAMKLEVDESRVPELSRFRKACLGDRHDEMAENA